ncbi:DUF308 domain-containing protein [Streptomyces carpinensis]|uniref:DUF308 domain-containing protein n=1 Tax=Streptomyces carpinensis TaxID=66369 RepID=UPI003CC626B0
MLFVLAGVLCLRHRPQTVVALSLIVGIVRLVSGTLTAYTAPAMEDLAHRGFVLCVAGLGAVAGTVVPALPTQSALALPRLLGLWLVLLGLWLVLLGVAEPGFALVWRSPGPGEAPGARRADPRKRTYRSPGGSPTWTGTEAVNE